MIYPNGYIARVSAYTKSEKELEEFRKLFKAAEPKNVENSNYKINERYAAVAEFYIGSKPFQIARDMIEHGLLGEHVTIIRYGCYT